MKDCLYAAHVQQINTCLHANQDNDFEARNYSCKLWERLGQTVTWHLAPLSHHHKFTTASFGEFAIGEIDPPSRHSVVTIAWVSARNVVVITLPQNESNQ